MRTRTGSPARHRNRRPTARVAIRLLAVGILVLGTGGSADLVGEPDRRQARADAAAEAVAHRTELEALRRLADATQRTDRGERSPLREAVERAEAQAAEAAEAAEQRASRADGIDPSPAPAPEPEPAPAPADEQPSDPVGPVPDSCGEYSGNRATGCALLLDAGHGLDQMSCLDNLWTKESGWNHRAQNPSSGAYGIPQALPGDKMAVYGDDWRTNPATQIRWGLSYIGDRYGSPCAAWRFSQANGWY